MSVLTLLLVAHSAASPIQERADRFLATVNATYKALYYVASEAQWAASTDVKPEHDAAAATAGKAMGAFNGNPALIGEARELLKHQAELAPLTVRQLQRVLLNAAEAPMTNPDLVKKRIEAETAQASTMNGFTFTLEGKPVTPNEIDRILSTSTDLKQRQAAWEASKQSGPALKPGLVRLQALRNGVAKELGYPDYLALQTASYGMTPEEMVKLQQEFMRELRPLYLQLHTYVKHELAKKYGQPVPDRIPAHWLNNRWSQNWTGLVEAADVDPYFKGRSAEWVVKTAERFYVGLGFPALPATFWTKSDLYPIPADGPRKKNTHASCWHLDLENDIRSLMSVEPDSRWFRTTHHELGHAYYFMSYTRPEVPPLLRLGANPSFHEAMGYLIGLAAAQVPYLKAQGILPADYKADPIAFLLDDALANAVPFIFWGSGTMTHWEADVYSKGLDPDQWNARWWHYVREFQGVEPPVQRGEEWCDAATKTHVNDNPAYYYSYAIANVLVYQFHDHIAKKILKQDPRSCDYADNKAVGAFLKSVMEKGGTEDWRKVLREATGEDLSTRAMVDYFKPLMAWLEKQNAGRKIGWE